MPKALSRLIFAALLATLCSACIGSSQALARPLMPTLDAAALQWLGDRIFQNECSREPRCLTAWNAGEDFPSLGLGHFIWYRAGQQEAFTESFPALLAWLEQEGLTLPAWIEQQREQPWPDRDSFLADLDGPELSALRQLLQDTMPEQARFIVARFDSGLESMLATLPAPERQRMEEKISHLLAAAPQQASFALIDYAHFKGEGSNPRERYAEQGWGLLQVLQAMPDHSAEPLADFVASARAVLARRVANAPLERNEQRWLAGWHKRVDGYLETTQ